MASYQYSAWTGATDDRYGPRGQGQHEGFRTPRQKIGTIEAPASKRRVLGEQPRLFQLLSPPQTSAATPHAATYELNKSVLSLETQVESLTREIDRLNETHQNHVGEAAGNPVAMFILQKVVEAGDLGLDVLVENLTAPHGWVSFAQLWRAELIDCYGDFVVPTDAGVDIAKWYTVPPAPDAADAVTTSLV
jgi:hypothetical protein